jgi:hypothetical protein
LEAFVEVLTVAVAVADDSDDAFLGGRPRFGAVALPVVGSVTATEHDDDAFRLRPTPPTRAADVFALVPLPPPLSNCCCCRR